MKSYKKKNNLAKVLIVDDNEDFLNSLIENPILNESYSLIKSNSCESAYNVIQNMNDLIAVLLDFDFKPVGTLNRMNGLDLLKIISQQFPDLPVIMMSGIGEGRGGLALEAIKNYASVFLDKPFKINTLVEHLNKLTKEKITSNSDTDNIQKRINESGYITKNLFLASQINDALEILNNSDLNILIYGETGTGKTKIANILHSISSTKDSGIYELHCGLINHDINSFKSQLFGHKKGAYTGAIDNKAGILDNQGTIIFDDIQHITTDVQKGLLQVFQSKVYSRLGDDSKKMPFKSRIISTSTLSKQDLLREGMLEEFFYRIQGELIKIPPLRERKEDIPLLINFFAKTISRESITYDNQVVEYLMNLDWLGNIRQLEDFSKRLLIHSKERKITLKDLQREIMKDSDMSKDFQISKSDNEIPNLEAYLDKTRKDIILQALKINKGNISETSKALGYKNHHGLKYWLDQYNIDASNYRN